MSGSPTPDPMGDQSGATTSTEDRWRRLDTYPLFGALRDRRSRRFSPGMQISQGPLAFTSKKPPRPLTEEEQAVLAFAACGITGASLADWSYAPGSGGQMMAHAVGRTVPSADAVHTTALFVIDDEATWLTRRPQDLEPEVLTAVVDHTRAGRYVEAWRALRVKVAEGRTVPGVEPPANIPGNRWSLYREGTTFFLPVSDLTYLGINAMLNFLSEDSGFFLLDDRRMFLPAGLAKFATSVGGHLDDDPRNGKAMPLTLFERIGGEFLAVEQGAMVQNLSLACEALGIAGFPAFAAHEESWFTALGFRLEEMPMSQYIGIPWPTALLLKLARRTTTMSYPIGLERDGHVLLHAYTPPYYSSMEAAVHAVVEDKHGPGGIYGGGEPGVFEQRSSDAGWRDPDAVGSRVPPESDKAVAATVAATEYAWKHYSRFPTTYAPFHTQIGFQAGHLDEEFYDVHYRPGSLSESHRSHDAVWHAD